MQLTHTGDPSPHATGPRTPEGKARSAMNALKDGFRAATLLIPDGMQDDCNALEKRLRLAFQPLPGNEAEQFFFERILHDAWTVYRIERKQAAMAASGIDPIDDPACEKEFARLERYHARSSSSFRSHVRLLASIQTNRILQQLLPQPLETGTLPVLAKVTQILQLAKRTRKDFPALAINTLASKVRPELRQDFGHPCRGTTQLSHLP